MSKANVLVIDDDRQVCGYIKTVLELADFAVQTVESAEDAELLLVNCRFDLILLDYGLPGRNGAEFLQNTAIPGSTKVILITSKLNRELVKSMFQLGICGYVEKPINSDELIRHVAFHLHRRLAPAGARSAQSLQPVIS